MSALDSFERAGSLIRQNPSLADFDGGASTESIEAAERCLGVTFPPSYKLFLKEFGVGSFYGTEFYGVVNGNVPGQSIPCVVFATLDDRKHPIYPTTFVTVMSTGYGTLLCFDARQSSEPSIVLWHAGMEPGEKAESISNSFGEFLLSEIEQCLRAHSDT